MKYLAIIFALVIFFVDTKKNNKKEKIIYFIIMTLSVLAFIFHEKNVSLIELIANLIGGNK